MYRVVNPSKKVPDLNCGVQDLLLKVVDLKQEVPDLRSAGIPPQQRAAGLLLWARQAGDIDRLDERRSAVTASGVTLSADVGS